MGTHETHETHEITPRTFFLVRNNLAPHFVPNLGVDAIALP
ncbi:MAG: hypothetical protein WDN04_01070 [Rhodospirillales bacterium]